MPSTTIHLSNAAEVFEVFHSGPKKFSSSSLVSFSFSYSSWPNRERWLDPPALAKLYRAADFFEFIRSLSGGFFNESNPLTPSK